MSKVVYEGWMVRYGRRKIGRSYIHMRYFVLESQLLAYYKRKPQDNVVPIKTLLIDGNCRVEDRGLKTHNGHMIYVLSIYNTHEKYHRITMAAFNIQEALIWKEKIELVIDQDAFGVTDNVNYMQHQESLAANGKKYQSFGYKSGRDNGRNGSSSDQESQFSAAEDEEDSQPDLPRRTTIGNGPPDSIFDWTQEISDLSKHNTNSQALSTKHWRLLQCQNGLRIFEELIEVDLLPKSCSRAMKAVGVVEATCEEVFELVMNMDTTRFEWDCSFQYGSLVEEVDGHTSIVYHRLLLDWFPTFVWPRDLCYVRYWRRNDDGSYVVLFCSREHEKCGRQPGFVRAHIESGGFNISPMKPWNGRPRTQVQHLMQIDLKGWGVGYASSFQQHCLFQMLNSVAGLREYFSQMDKINAPPRIPVMVNLASASVPARKGLKLQKSGNHYRSQSLDQISAYNKKSLLDDSDDDEEYQLANGEASTTILENDVRRIAIEEEPKDELDLSCFSGNLRQDDSENGRDCWRIADGNNFRVRSKRFCYDKSKVASDKGYFSLVVNLQRFVDGDDEFRNSRLKLIPSVPKGSWIVRQSVGSTPCLLGKAVDCNYIRGPKYLEIDVDIGSSTVANGVLGLVIGVMTSLVVEMAFLVQATTTDELPERLISAVRVSHIELSSAIVPKLELDPPE
uniref:START domain-containing protein n=1 Tax=Daucus carota subsp. sativus TaxID=79200 RepID=A0A166F4Z1_DAUCS